MAKIVRNTNGLLELYSNHSFEGRWWRVNDTRSKRQEINGAAKYFAPDGDMILAASSSFKNAIVEDTLSLLETDWYPGVIHGFASRKRITLFDCFLLSSQASFRRGQFSEPTEYVVNMLVVGDHYASRDDLQFESLEFEVKDLDYRVFANWFKPSAARVVRLSIHSDWFLEIDGRGRGSRRAPIFRLGVSGIAKYNILFFKMNLVVDLFGLLLGQSLQITTLTARIKRKSIKILYGHSRSSANRKHTRKKSLGIIDDMNQPDFEKYLKSWLQMSEQVRIAFYQFIACRKFQSEVQTVTLISYTQCLEAFHRAIFGNSAKYLPDKEYADVYGALVDAIPSSVPNNLKTSLEKRLFHGNEFSQRKRINELVKRAATKMPIFKELNAAYVGKVVDTRNYYIHFDPATTGRLTYRGIPFAIFSLECLLESLFLLEIGVPEAKIETAIKESKEWKNFLYALRVETTILKTVAEDGV